MMIPFPTEWKVIKIPWFQSPPTSDMFHHLSAPAAGWSVPGVLPPSFPTHLPDIAMERRRNDDWNDQRGWDLQFGVIQNM